MSPASPTPAPAAASWRRDLAILAAVFGVLYLLCLGRPPLMNPDEGRYADIPREMVATGDWVTPRLDGVNYFEKPPLMYWTVAAGIKAFGESEFSVRLAPPLFALGGVLLAYAGTRRMFGRAAGIGAAAALGFSALYAGLARLLILDMAVSVLMSATLFCFILGVRESAPDSAAWGRRRWFFYGVYASAALATMTKGLMGFLVTGAVMVLWLALYGQWKRLLPLYLPSGIALFLAITAPWHILAARRNPAWAHFYFINQHWERFTTTEHGRFHPWYWFIPIVLGGLFPWVGFLGAALRSAFAGGWARRKEHADKGFFLVWAAFIFVFFSKSQSKLAPYILPVFPPLAVLIGIVLARIWENAAAGRPSDRGEAATARPAGLAAGVATFAIACDVLAAVLLAVVTVPARFRIEADKAAPLHGFAFAVATLLAAGGIVTLWMALRGQVRGTLVAVAATMACFLMGADLGSRRIYRLIRPSTKSLALWVRANSRPGDRIFHYADFFHDFLYYSGRNVGTVGFHGDEIELQNDPIARASGRFIEKPEFLADWAEPGRVLVVARKNKPETELLLSDPAFHYRLLAQTPDFYLLGNEP